MKRSAIYAVLSAVIAWLSSSHATTMAQDPLQQAAPAAASAPASTYPSQSLSTYPTPQEPVQQLEPGPIEKAGRGLSNVSTCWLELPRQIVHGWRHGAPVIGVGWGVLKGSGLAVTRLAVGAYETITFVVPYPNGYASPYPKLGLYDFAWE